ncbi:MAG: hypothetical protein COS19_12700 [Flavobacteriaceae bacterium CG02_land_8_20_14_3_00_34_13]|nr:MAG: hypothetical protein COS19_12700 [Flavobacteriaceae bacterium CG02_land_8_20_14_3_00_34_13]PIZ07393.1 MAG: hypothetical protein COY56_09285 [Flavobacteriaceae bacterium CG_4_10_14_0_8_um_filter_34_31]PJC06836.1 MAG: hypothetical protein CO068_09155 [Flavobacteriaceae bacterium CG_4_9_14_0_8_um_filter_34_30]
MNKINRFVIKIFWLYLIILLCTSCFGPDVEITRDYFSNGDWKKKGTWNTKMDQKNIAKLLIDSNIIADVYNQQFDFNKIKPLAYKIDTTFWYTLHTEGNLFIKTIYFDKEQENIFWYDAKNPLGPFKKTIGILELDSWYRINGLRDYWTFYVYVDKKGNTHLFKRESTGFGV